MVDCFLCTFGRRARHACVVQTFFHDGGEVLAIVGDGERVTTGATCSHWAHYGEIFAGGRRIRGRCGCRGTDGREFGVVGFE